MKKATVIFTTVLILVSTTLSAETLVYTVKKGDTLSEICLLIKGNGSPAVWEAEAEKLNLENPHLIFPGQILKFQNFYRVEWESSSTGFKGHGEWSESKKWISSVVEQSNKQFPDLIHRIGTK